MFTIVFMMVNAFPVFAADENTASDLLDSTTTIGTLAVVGTGGAGAIAVSRNNKKRKERLDRNKQTIDVNKTYRDKDLRIK